jgi:hypothetical protein
MNLFNASFMESIATPGRTLRCPARIAIGAMIFLTAFGIRLLYWQDSRAEISRGNTILTGLSYFYDKEAQRILDEGGILFPNVARESGDAWMVIHPPGYAILLTMFFVRNANRETLEGIEQSGRSVRFIQITADAAAAVLIFLIAAQLLPVVLATMSGLLAAFSPHFAYYSLGLSPDTLAVLPILLAIYFLIKCYARPHLMTMMGVGAMIGLSCWFRANALLLAPFLSIIVFLLFERGKRLRYSSLLIASTLLVIAPITIRNWVVYKEFIPLSIGAGITLIEGIADYDSEEKFSMPPNDTATSLKDAQWHNRPEYADDLWIPDGVERDRYRFARGMDVIRNNPVWFSKVMLRRTESMLRYNDFRPPVGAFCITTAPVIARGPGFDGNTESVKNKDSVWHNSATEILQGGTNLSAQAQTSILENNQRLQIVGDDSTHAEQFSFAPLAVKRTTNYILRLPVTVERGNVAIKVSSIDSRDTLALVVLSEEKRKKKKKRQAQTSDIELQQVEAVKQVEIPFASSDNDEVKIVISNNGTENIYPIVEIGTVELFELDATPYQWTRLPRSIIRAIQKNLYKTDVLRLLILLGIVLLAFARQKHTLMLLLAVPLYYLCVQSFFHTEYRYTLAIHYFLFVFAAAAIYFAGVAMMQILRHAKSRF